MDVAGAKRTVLVSTMALIFIAIYRDRVAPNEVAFFRRLWGVGVLSVLLATAADFVPRVAGPFALLTVLGAMTQGGDRAFVNALSNLGGGAKAASSGNGDFTSGAHGDTGGGGNFPTTTGTATDRAATSNGRVGK